MKCSFEFFPPRNAEQELVLQSTWQKLARLEPGYLSVTFGAGGSTQEATHRTVLDLIERSGVPVAPHISCMAPSLDVLDRLLDTYAADGVDRLVVLRGDWPEDADFTPPFRYASELVAHVHDRHPGRFSVEVGCYPEIHPESESMDSEIRWFKEKVDAGADAAITQYFFNADAYFEFVERCRAAGISIPIIPGIMPITNYTQLARFSARCGAKIPAALAEKLQSFGDDGAAIRDYGLDVVTKLCEDLVAGGAPGLHFYTLNRANATMKIWQRLNGDHSSP
ncbi:methylenetetrahydrofolate reductase [NAD(P)H] [Marinihelvus fidelis]|uniref:Methylenetetrahydrofolate reductase n=1 Tax=Marinihelvus fidelis TaxID=2613842 RepID=A0A5N0T7Q2_9GAMM|nr:methylenetetrahydrofolate reductase [NAD(P)H] [Marinihelvus fidelis]KAA9130950.1 methylenetetrahydrofolate reductase [NAD(P)H] [Marinihelvus fidelis]